MKPASLHTRPSARSRRSIRTQLMVWNVLALALLFLILGAVTRYAVLSSMMASVDRDLADRASMMAHGPPPPPPGFPPGPPPSGFRPEEMGRMPPPSPPDRLGPPQPDERPESDSAPDDATDLRAFRPLRWDLQGRSLEPFGASAPWDATAFALARQGQETISTVDVDGEPVRILSRPFPSRGPIRGVIQVPYPLTEINRAMASMNRAFLVLLPVALLCAGMAGAYLTERMLRRVRDLAQAAGQIGAQALSARLPAAGNDEFSDLAQTFNHMLARLEEAFRKQERLVAQQRRFTADASHELKTPLTIIKGNTSLLLKEETLAQEMRPVIADMDQAAGVMARLVQDLLLLARSDEGQLGQDRIVLPVGEVLARAAARVRREESAPLSIAVSDPTLSVLGNEEELLRLFANLLDNAARYTPADGQITVQAARDGSQAAITITDTGCGIAPEHLAHLGERFYRVEAARSRPEGGTGLGLAICKSIVEGHQGTITFASAVGAGTTVRVTLPAAA